MKLPVPSEHKEQSMVITWSQIAFNKYPALGLLHAVPNGGKRDIVTASILKAEGVRPGVPDLCLPVPRGGYHGLYIEMKKIKGGTMSDDQKWWIEQLSAQGYRVEVCRGNVAAIKVLEDYLKCQ